MALPAELTSVTVAGTYVDFAGDPRVGTVTFTPPAWLQAVASNMTVVPSSIVATLDADGSFSVSVPASDDPDLTPTFTYTVVESFKGDQARSYSIDVPYDTAGVLYLPDVSPVASDSGTYLGKTVFDVRAYGAVSGQDATVAIDAAAAAASPSKGLVYFPGGTWMTDGVDFSGLDCTPIGAGSQQTTIKANAGITGYVMTLPSDRGDPAGPVPFGGFKIEGTGVADATKARGGLSITGRQYLHAYDILIKNTGGPALYLDSVMLSTFDNIVSWRPIGADTNDVPYVHIRGACNGNTYNHWGFRSGTTDPDGSVVCQVQDDGAYTPTNSAFVSPWLEYLHTPENGSVFDLGSNMYAISDMHVFDSASSIATPTNNSIIRIKAPTISGYGGNIIRGKIPPGNPGSGSTHAFGIIVESVTGRNRIEGVRGYHTNNVRLDEGTSYNYVELGGRVSGVDTVSGVVNNSGNTTNVIVDTTARSMIYGDVNLYRSAADTWKTDDSLHVGADFAHLGTNFGAFGHAVGPQPAAYTPTNVVANRVYDADAATVAELADVLGTLIADLQSVGMLG